MKRPDISSRLTRFAFTAALVISFCSCREREGQLDFQILTHTMWYEEHRGGGATVARLYEFDEGGMVSIYPLSGNKALAGGEYHYIFTPADELLAIESVGAFRVEDIDVDAISLEELQSGKPFKLTKYTGELELP